MKTAEQVMENLISYLYQSIHLMLELVIDEEYEKAAQLRDEVEFYILSTSKYLTYNKLTKTELADIYDNLIELKINIIEEISDMMNIPIENRIEL